MTVTTKYTKAELITEIRKYILKKAQTFAPETRAERLLSEALTYLTNG